MFLFLLLYLVIHNNMCLRNIKLITFDVTNTLLKFRISPGEQYGVIGQKYGFNIPHAEIAKEFRKAYKIMGQKHPNFGHSKMTWQEWWTQVVKYSLEKYVLDKGKLNLIATALIEEYTKKDTWTLASGCIELLNYLEKLPVTLGVISNFDPRLHNILKNTDMNEYFDFVVTSYECGHQKPDTKIFLEAFQHSKIVNLKPSEALHIGDNYELDYLGAINAGWKALLINPKMNTEKLTKNLVFDDLQQLTMAITENNLILR